MSASESNSRPKGLSCPPKRARRPSRKSKTKAPRTHQIAVWKRSLAASGLDACSNAPSRIFSVAVNPQNRFPAVIKIKGGEKFYFFLFFLSHLFIFLVTVY